MGRGTRRKKKSDVPARIEDPARRESTSGWLEHVPIILLLAAFTLFAFSPALDGQFLNWDDEKNFLKNPSYRGLSGEHLAWMFSSFHMGHYQPLSWVTLGLDYELGGMNPRGYHRTSLLWHALNVVLFYAVAIGLISRCPGLEPMSRWWIRFAAATGALLFGVHPLRVESVAWITERRDVVAGAFFLLTILAYLKAARSEPGRRRPGWWGLAIAAFALSLLSKAWGITLPVVLLLLDRYPLGRWSSENRRRLLLEKVPFLLLAAGAAVAAVLAQDHAEATHSWAEHGLADRLLQAGFGIGFYLYKTLWPASLSPLYPLETPLDWTRLGYWLGAGAAVALTGLAWCFRRRLPAVTVAWFTYLIIVSPVLGLAQSGPQIAADRYTYLACLPWAALGAGALLWLARQRRAWRSPMVAISVLIVVVLTSLTHAQSHIWRSSEALWQHSLEYNRESYIAQYNLGRVYQERGDVELAIPRYRAARDLRPDDLKVRQDLGAMLGQRGELDLAMEEWRAILDRQPDHRDALYSMGLATFRQGRFEDSVGWFERVLQVAPGDEPAEGRLADALTNLGVAREREGHVKRAIELWRRALRLQPGHRVARANLERRIGR